MIVKKKSDAHLHFLHSVQSCLVFPNKIRLEIEMEAGDESEVGSFPAGGTIVGFKPAAAHRGSSQGEQRSPGVRVDGQDSDGSLRESHPR